MRIMGLRAGQVFLRVPGERLTGWFWQPVKQTEQHHLVAQVLHAVTAHQESIHVPL
jgi:hypothetical protein